MSESVLLVDDDELVRASLELEAVDAGYRVACAASGPEALELARVNHFDAIVCDIRMPGMNGLEVIEHLKQLQPYIRTMVITGYASPDTPVRALKMRVDDYLLKPFDGPTFLASLRRVLDSNRREQKDGAQRRAHQDALLGILGQTCDSERTELAEFAATRASATGLSPQRVRLVYLCALLNDVDLSFLSPFSGLNAVARILREVRESVPDMQPEARVLAGARADFESGEREESFVLPEADWIGVENLMRLAAKHRAVERWKQADALYKRILESSDLEADMTLDVRLEQFVLSLERGKPLIPMGREVQAQAAKLGLERTEARATLHLARLEPVESAALEKARRVFEGWDDSVEAAACGLLLGAEESALNGAGLRQQALMLMPEFVTEERSDHQCFINLFGPLRVTFHGKAMPDSDWVSRKDRLLFAYLCAHAGRVITEEILLELLWNRGGDRARHSLHNSVSQTRRVLSRNTELHGKELVERVGDGYRLGERVRVDLSLFREALENGRRVSLSGGKESALPFLRKADSLARGEFLEGDYIEWTFPLREEIRALQIDGLSLLARQYSLIGDEEKACRYWRRVLQLDTCIEEAYEALFRALKSAGRESESFRLYQAAEQSFEEELGLSVPMAVVRAYRGA